MRADLFKVYPATVSHPDKFIFCATPNRTQEQAAADVAPEYLVLEELGAVLVKTNVVCRHWLLEQKEAS